jgi:hypothetical protein
VKITPVVLLVLAALALLQPISASAEYKSIRVPLWADAATNGLAQYAIKYRLTHNTGPGRNMTVFRFTYPNGQPGVYALESLARRRHAERRLHNFLTEHGIDPDTITEVYTELEPCSFRGQYCKPLLESLKGLRTVWHSLDYPYEEGVTPEKKAADKAQRTASVTVLTSATKASKRGFALGTQIMDAPGRQAGSGSLPVALGAPQVADVGPCGPACSGGTGGIDFSSLELRYVADTGGAGERGLSYAFRGRPGTTPPDAALGVASSLQASDAFFVWLALPPQSFWVNLNPTEPNRIIDPQFARSDAGRVLLESDLLMKKAVAPLVHPDSPTGAAFWKGLDDLYGNRPGVATCMSFRQWIVPARATVYATARELYILDAPLEVKMESDYLGPGTAVGDCPMDAPALNAAKQDLYRRLILPLVQNLVSTHAAFAPLRRVYLSRIAAEWFRQRSAQHPTALRRVANSGRIDRWLARPPWNPLDVFNRYVASVRDGEFKVERPVQYGPHTYAVTYVYGGVDFSQTPARNVGGAEFKARFPTLAARVRRALQRPARDPQRGEVWLGGSSGGR